MGPLGSSEIFFLVLLFLLLTILCVVMIFNYTRQKSRLKELEKQIREKDPRH